MGTDSPATDSPIGDLIQWIMRTFGREMIVSAREWLGHQWQRLLAARNILILGSKGSGKSALLHYLKGGKPYEIVEGEIRPPAPTALAAVVDQKFALQKKNWLRLKRDVPGDLNLRDTWAQAISDVKPHGIVYMVDGRRSDDDLRQDVRDIDEFVLQQYSTGVGNLAALHVFVNFADHWARTSIEEYRRIRIVEDELHSILARRDEWTILRRHVAATQLSPNKRNWEEARRALYHFGADLVT